MAGLLYKELLLNKKNIMTIGLGILFLSLFVFMPLPSEMKEDVGVIYTLLMCAVLAVLFILAGIVQNSAFAYDERKQWSNFICATPLSVKGQVLSKYYFALLVSIAMLVYCSLIFSVNAVIQGTDCGATSFVYIACIVQLFMRSFEFPFLIRFGSKNGNYYRMACTGIILFLVFIYFLFGDLSAFGTLDEFVAWFDKLRSGGAFSDVTALLIALLPFVVGGLYYFSYKISCRLYLKGAECYDK